MPEHSDGGQATPKQEIVTYISSAKHARWFLGSAPMHIGAEPGPFTTTLHIGDNN